MKKIVWVGSRESDIKNEILFSGSITRYGNENELNTSFCNNSLTNDYTTFIRKSTEEYVSKMNAYFIFANEHNAYKCSNEVFSNSLCVNKLPAIESLNNKIFIRNYLRDVVPVPESIVLNSKSVTDYSFVKSVFNNKYSVFVVQDPNGAGGIETTFLTEYENRNDNRYLLITPYISNGIPINTHIVVAHDEYRIFPPSIQVIKQNFCYMGSDYIRIKDLEEKQIKQIFEICQKIAKKIMSLGVNGLFGVDLLIAADYIYFLECNFRYQGSSFLLNKALIENDLPSYFKIQYDSFYHSISRLPIDTYNLPIEYSSFRRTEHSEDLILPKPIEIKIDGDINKMHLRSGYKYYEIFNQSITDSIQL